mgnify:FL=1|jgi:hypothetical protein|tara:strand:- start:3302 stop:3886 length:585 start_codon:yes stop_codon:yes gene_type:complete
MELLIGLAMKFWQWSLLIAFVILGFAINLFDRKKPKCYTFAYTSMPDLKPLPIKTKGKGFFKAIVMWLLGTRNWELTNDFTYVLNGNKYVIPAGFKFDGASIPKFLRTFFSPVGVLLLGGLVHDYAYKYETLLRENKRDTLGKISQKRADEIFRDININVNGFYLMNYLAYWSLRLGGFVAWNGHRKRNVKIGD